MKIDKPLKKPKDYWKNKENIIEESKKYSSRTEFKKGSHRAYDMANKYDMLDDMPWLSSCDRLPIGYWKNKENVLNEAKKYTSKEEFKNGNISAFLAAYRYGYIDEMDWLVKQPQNKKGYWTYEKIEKEAIKYKTKSEFKKNSPFVYEKALKLGIIDDFFLNNYIQY